MPGHSPWWRDRPGSGLFAQGWVTMRRAKDSNAGCRLNPWGERRSRHANRRARRNHATRCGIAYAVDPTMIDPRIVLMGSVAYFREHPQELLRVVRQAGRMRFGVPIAALRWLAMQFEGDGGPQEVEMEAVPPGIRITATIEEMGTLLRGSATLTVESVRISTRELRVEVQLTDVSVRLLDDEAKTPLAALVRSGALDLSRIASLVAHMPARPTVLVEAVDNRIVLDFMRLPRLSTDERARRIIGALSSLVGVAAVETDASYLEVAIKALPNGFGSLFPQH
jgi:hypothetical protein